MLTTYANHVNVSFYLLQMILYIYVYFSKSDFNFNFCCYMYHV